MKQGNEIDKLFREGVYNHETPVPEFIWENIQAEQRSHGATMLDQLKKKWGLMILLFGIGIGSTLVGLTYTNPWSNDADSSAHAQHMLASSQQWDKNTGGKEDVSIRSNNAENRTTKETKNEQLAGNNTAANTEAPGRTKGLSKNASTTEAKRNAAEEAAKQTVNQKPSNKSPKFSNKSAAAAIKSQSYPVASLSAGTLSGISQDELAELNLSDTAAPAFITSQQRGNIQKANTNSVSQSQQSANQTASKPLQESSAKTNANTSRSGKWINQINKRPAGTISNSKGFTSQKEKKFSRNRANDCFPEMIKSKMLALEAFVSPDFASRQLSTYDQNLLEHVNKRENTEERQISWSAGLRLDIAFHRNLHLKTGLSYAQINEYFSHLGEETTVKTTTIQEIEENGQIIIDTLTTFENWQRVVKNYNRYRFFDVPLLLSYETQLKRLKVSVNAGTIFNLYFTQSGFMLSPDETVDTPVALRENGESPFFRNFNAMSLYGGLSFYYRVAEQIEVMAEPHFKYMLEPLNKVSYPVEQSYQTVGLNLGLRYKF